ncbi:hypothetical protein GCM10010350_21500 [Streptomyces galilaeus]|nr:hypothetical protein GCM10010350_21500 [Streptomyces galilaeus]
MARSRALALIVPPAAVSSSRTATPRINGVTASSGTWLSGAAVGVVLAGIVSPVRRSRQVAYGSRARVRRRTATVAPGGCLRATSG